MQANEIALKWAPRVKQARILALLDELASQILTHGKPERSLVAEQAR